MNALLDPPKADGFPIGMIVKCVGHADHPEYIGWYFRISGEAYTPEMATVSRRLDDRGFGLAGQSQPRDTYHGQRVETLDGLGRAFFALSWMRPATAEEIAELGL